VYDLGDAVQWEFFFPNVDKPLLVVPGDEPKLDEPEDEENLEVCKLMKNVTFDHDDLYQIRKFPNFTKCPTRVHHCGVESNGVHVSLDPYPMM
jgi:hypothetical protein